MRLVRLFNNVRRITRHPLVKTNKTAALKRYLVFHLVHRLLPGRAVYPFVEGLHYLGMPGDGLIAGNIYTGLFDFQEMAFMAHFLREDDVFLDVGANVGVYTLLAAGFCRAKTIAVEPIPATYQDLLINLRLNDLHTVVRTECVGLGDERATVRFVSSSNAAWSHVASPSEEHAETVAVDVVPMDELVDEVVPTMIKIDVEGYEYAVLNGGTVTLTNPGVHVVIVELNGSGRKYGVLDEDVHALLLSKGLLPHIYDPFTRKIMVLDDFTRHNQNVLYIRDANFVRQRVVQGRTINVRGRAI